jgi:ElaB/YqjD/DUF883 family membrane-anchored ribosome-binding protein
VILRKEGSAMTANNADDTEQHGPATSGVGATLRAVADDLRNGSSQEQILGQIVGSLADASDGLRDKDLGDAVNASDTFARQNPFVFLGAAALAGFAATRLVKAVTSTDAPPEEDTA